MAMSAARVWKTSPLATKSVSQLTSTRMPRLQEGHKPVELPATLGSDNKWRGEIGRVETAMLHELSSSSQFLFPGSRKQYECIVTSSHPQRHLE